MPSRKRARTTTPVESTATDGDASFPTWGIVLTYLLVSAVFFFPALTPGRMLFGTDYVASAYFFEEFATSQFRSGSLPSWLPYVYGGVPFFANPMDVYYPVSVLLRVLWVPTYEHLGILFVIQFFLAGLGTHALMRELGTRQAPAFLVGLSYMFSGYLISNIYAGHDGRAIVATLAPLLFFALHRGIRTAQTRWFVAAGAVLGSAFLSFQIQTAYYLSLAAALWALFLLWRFGALTSFRALAGRVRGGLITLTIAVALASVNFVPFLGYVEASPRGGGRGYEYSVSYSMPPEETVGLAVPERIGILDAYTGRNPFKLHTEYAGALVIGLLILAFGLRMRSAQVWFFGGLGLFFLIMAYGGYTPIYRLYYAVLPGVSKFRAPSVCFFLVVMSLTVLAGLTLDRLLTLRARLANPAKGNSSSGEKAPAETARTLTYLAAFTLAAVVAWAVIAAITPPSGPPPGDPTPGAVSAARAALNHPAYVRGIWRFALFLFLTFVALWAWVRHKVSTRPAVLLLAALTITDLWVIDKRFFITIPEPTRYFAPDEIASFLSRQSRPFRTFVLFDQPQDDYLIHFGLELVGGEHGNQLQTYNEFLGAGETTYTDFHNMGQPIFLALANARFIVTAQEIRAGFLRPVFRGQTRTGREATVYENDAVLPRVFLVPSARKVSGLEDVLGELRSGTFDPRQEVLIYSDPPWVMADSAMSLEGSARITQHGSDEVNVQVRANRPAYLVLTDNFYDGWIADVDGTPASVLRAYHTFRAVPVPAGEHSVRFLFKPRSLAVGFGIYLMTCLILVLYTVGVGVTSWRRRRA